MRFLRYAAIALACVIGLSSTAAEAHWHHGWGNGWGNNGWGYGGWGGGWHHHRHHHHGYYW